MGKVHGVNMKGKPLVGREGLEERRSLVLDMQLRGLSPAGIARVLQIHRNTVHRDLAFLKKKRGEDLEDSQSPQNVGDITLFLDGIIRQAMTQYQATKVESAQIGFLQVALAATEKKAKLLLETGYIQKDPQQISHRHSGQIKHDFSKLPMSDLLKQRNDLRTQLEQDPALKIVENKKTG